MVLNEDTDGDVNQEEKWKLQWNRHVALLKMYKKIHGNCLVPNKYVAATGEKLGKWVSHVRSGNTKVTQQRRLQLKSLGFVWNAADRSGLPRKLSQSAVDAWNRNVALLKEYKLEHGDCLVPFLYETLSGEKLGQWVNHVRSGNNKVTPERRLQLEELDFVWKVERQHRNKKRLSKSQATSRNKFMKTEHNNMEKINCIDKTNCNNRSNNNHHNGSRNENIRNNNDELETETRQDIVDDNSNNHDTNNMATITNKSREEEEDIAQETIAAGLMLTLFGNSHSVA